jgi:hypothetical protein
MSTSFVTSGHVRALQAVTTQLYGEVTLASCRINGEPGVAIVLMEQSARARLRSCPCSRRSPAKWKPSSKAD